jgi:ferrous iron transport protein B
MSIPADSGDASVPRFTPDVPAGASPESPAPISLHAADEPAPGRQLIAILGNPNAGKSTLFNRLTGLRQKVGNYPGVTVERKIGLCRLPSGKTVDILDLPGSYSIRPGSPDEMIVRDVLLGIHPDTRSPDLVIFVLDATQLDRHLFLALQVIQIGRPVVLALNMIDMARSQGIEIDESALEQALGVPVVSISAAKGLGIGNLRRILDRQVEPSTARFSRWPPQVERVLQSLVARLPRLGLLSERGRADRAMALLLDDGEDDAIARYTPPDVLDDLRMLRQRLDEVYPTWRVDETAGIYESIEEVMARAVRSPGERRDPIRERIDRVLTHRIFGPAIFLILMAAVFQSVFAWAAPVMDLIDAGVTRLGDLVSLGLPAGPLRSLLVDGVIAGVGAIIVFVPQIAVLFLFIALLEDTGYMARAAFIMDRVMGKVGLSGRAFIPLLSSFACAIPGIMATRTIDNPRDRLTTILVAPFMSCSARLPVYALLIGAFIPDRRFGFVSLPGLVLFSMYMLGIVVAILAALVLKRTLLKGGKPLYVMELPPYRVPSPRSVLTVVRERCLLFLRKAGTVIFAISVALWFLASYPKGGDGAAELDARIAESEAAGNTAATSALRDEFAARSLENSFAGRAGRLLEPVIRPLGFDWRIGIGLLTSFAAREVLISTLGTVFNLGDADDDFVSLRAALRNAVDPRTGRAAYSPLVAVSLMVYFVLACQCISTLAITRRETNSWRWPALMLLMMNSVAWCSSFLVYQGGRVLGLGP